MRQRTTDAEARVEATEQLREGLVEAAKETVRELNRTPRNGSLKSYNKPELLDLAASMGVEGRTNMTKDELVEVITKAARGAGGKR